MYQIKTNTGSITEGDSDPQQTQQRAHATPLLIPLSMVASVINEYPVAHGLNVSGVMVPSLKRNGWFVYSGIAATNL